jgi:hypothetical protein
MQSALNMVNQVRRYRMSDEVEPSSDFQTNFDHARLSSPLLDVCLAELSPQAFRSVRCIARGFMEVHGGAWVLVTGDGMSLVGIVGEIVELVCGEESILRLQLCEARSVAEDSAHGSILTARISDPAQDLVVAVDCVSFHEVTCEARDGMLLYTYNF